MWASASLRDNLSASGALSAACSMIAFYSVWEVWRARNRLIFSGIKACVEVTVARISAWHSLSSSHEPDQLRAPPLVAEQHPFPFGFFDGAAQKRDCGAGIVLRDLVIHIHLKAGSGSNNRAELVALWALLWYAAENSIGLNHIYGDSLCVIDWARGRSELNTLLLNPCPSRVRSLINRFPDLTFSHLYRCYNGEADRLSKISLGIMDGFLHCKVFVDGSLTDTQVIRY